MAVIVVRDFLAALFTDVEGYIDVRTMPSLEQTFVKVPDWEQFETFVRPRRDRDCYFGVATRRTSERGTLANCHALPALFTDIDCKEVSPSDAREQLDSMALPPSVIVQSGGGLHAYWFLREPLDLQREAVRAKGLLRRLALSVGGDLAAAEPARVLRVPNTFNGKYQPRRPVVVDHFVPDRRYHASEFDDWLPGELSPRPASPPDLPDAIPSGRRNTSLTSLGGSMRSRGMTHAAILAALRIENAERCCPPLSDEEVVRIAKSVAGYAAAASSHRDDSHPLELTSLADLLSEPEESVDWLVHERIPLGGVVMLAGKPKSGKSTLARDLALQVARGGTWLGFQCLQRSVIYVALEDRRADVRRHFRGMGATGKEPLELVFGEGAGDLVTRLRAVAAADRPGLIIVDTLQRVIKARDLNDYAEVTMKLTPILMLARETGAAVLLVHHAGKAARGDALDTVLGSTALTGSVDNVLLLSRNDQYRTLRSIQRTGPDLPEMVLRLDATGETRADGTRAEADVRSVESSFVDALTSGPLERPALLDAVEARRTDKLSALKRLLATGTILRSGGGKREDPYIFTLAVANGGSQVPTQCAEPASQGPRILEFPKDSAPDCGSRAIADLERPGNHNAGGQTPDDQVPTPPADGPPGVPWDADEQGEDEP